MITHNTNALCLKIESYPYGPFNEGGPPLLKTKYRKVLYHLSRGISRSFLLTTSFDKQARF
jgi:hypothetical protein